MRDWKPFTGQEETDGLCGYTRTIKDAVPGGGIDRLAARVWPPPKGGERKNAPASASENKSDAR